MTEQLMINKTGLDMFDAFRAYGLALAVKGIRAEDIEVDIRDVNYAFVLTVEGSIPSSADDQLFVENEGWRRVFRTYRERKDSKKPNPREDVENILSTQYEELLETNRNPTFLSTMGKRVNSGRTLYQSLDISAAKGFREEKRGTAYHEGTQIEVDKYSWTIACLGAAFFGSWREGKDFIVSLVPNPLEVSITSHRQLQEDLNKKNLCNISSNAALAHYSVKLAEVIVRREASRETKYDSVIFNTMRKTGQQPKPGGGGRFGLEFLFGLIKEPHGYEALQIMDGIFRAGFIKGVKQSLAFAFADFLFHPTMENFRRCEDLNIRGHINENVHLWDKTALEAVLKHVEAV